MSSGANQIPLRRGAGCLTPGRPDTEPPSRYRRRDSPSDTFARAISAAVGGLASASACYRRRTAAVSDWYRPRVALTVRTDQEMEHALTALAHSEGTSRQEVIRRAVLERYERAGHRARVQQSTSLLADRWADVLDRLGKA